MCKETSNSNTEVESSEEDFENTWSPFQFYLEDPDEVNED